MSDAVSTFAFEFTIKPNSFFGISWASVSSMRIAVSVGFKEIFLFGNGFPLPMLVRFTTSKRFSSRALSGASYKFVSLLCCLFFLTTRLLKRRYEIIYTYLYQHLQNAIKQNCELANMRIKRELKTVSIIPNLPFVIARSCIILRDWIACGSCLRARLRNINFGMYTNYLTFFCGGLCWLIRRVGRRW